MLECRSSVMMAYFKGEVKTEYTPVYIKEHNNSNKRPTETAKTQKKHNIRKKEYNTDRDNTEKD